MWYLANPFMLLLLVPLGIGVLCFFFWRRNPKRPALVKLSGIDLLRKQSRRTRWVYRALFGTTVVSLILLGVAAARPTLVESWIEQWSEGIDIVLLLDVSESMDATDFEPNRMSVAKNVIRNFIKRRKFDRVGLVTFGGEAVTKCPLTRDYKFLQRQLSDVRLGELKQGTAIGMGMANAIGRLRYSQSKNRVVILITDGDSNVGSINPITAAHLARQEGIKVYTIGIGKKNRVLVPIYSRDAQGKKKQLVAQVPSYINPELLKEIAKLTGGNAYLARDPGMLTRILREIDALEKTRVKSNPKERKEELFFFPTLLATLLMAMGYGIQETRYRRSRVRAAA